MPSYYPKNLNRYAWFDKQDIITEAVTEDVTEGTLVARDLDNSGVIVKYDADEVVGDDVSGANEKPLGVVVYDDYDSGDVANIVTKGTFGDIFAHIKDHIDTFDCDDDGGPEGGKKVSFTLSHVPMDSNAVVTSPLKVETSIDAGKTYTEVDSSKYTVTTTSGTTTVTFASADDVPDEDGANDKVRVTYDAKVNDADKIRFESDILIRPITEIKREA